MPYLGSWKIDDVLTFPAITHRFDTGALTDADAVPDYRVYEDETSTAILTGNMAKLDDANTTGFYSEAITLSAANGFEKGKCYTVYITAAVNSVTGGQHHTFQIEAEVDANVVSDKASYTLANGAITAAVIATDAIDNDAIAANAVTEIQSGLATQASVDTIDDFLDTEIAAIKAKTDQLTFTVANKVDANMTHLSGNSTAADNLEAGADALVVSTCAAGSTTTSIVTNLTEATDDHYNGRVITFTSGALADQSSSISDYNGTTKTLTVVALTEAPVNTDAFVIS